MPRQGVLFWGVIAAVAAILIYQLFLPPIIGLADQHDFERVIGRFGYGPEQRISVTYVSPKYVRDPTFRAPDWEQITSEYLFTAAAVFLNKIVSKDGKLDIEVMGFVHALAFLAVFARLLLVTRNIRARALLWIGAAVILTDVGYVAYWNSFYSEPASALFCLLLLAESIEICEREKVSRANLIRWLLWAILWILAKPQNATLGVPLALFSLRLGFRIEEGAARYLAVAGSAVIAAASIMNFAFAPRELKNACTYNMVFLAILPESRNPAADLEALGLDPQLQRYSGTGAWSAGSAFPDLNYRGILGSAVTPAKVVLFYAARPARVWRHIRTILPIAFSLRPEWCGNFEPSAGVPPGARSKAFALWSGLHEHVIAPAGKFILFLPPVPVIVALLRRRSSRWIEFAALLTVCCLTAFFTAILGDAWDNVKHLFLFNLLLDACLLAAAAFAVCVSSFWRTIHELETDHDARPVRGFAFRGVRRAQATERRG